MKRLLQGAAIAAGVAVVGLLAVAFWIYSTADQSNIGELEFGNELRIPPLLEGRADEDGRKVFDLDLEQGETELLPGKPAQTWGINGPYLGPTLRASLGDEVLINVHNGLPDETTTMHWHGMHLPAPADGGPHQIIEPRTTWSPSWRIDQPATTLWYHPHLHEATEDHVYRGLAGMFILDDPRAERLSLPDDYGVDDIPLIVQDKRFEDDGELDFSQGMISPIGRLGDEILVNGTHDPHVEVTDERVRFRLLNASTARIYDIGFADERPFELIGTDGGLMERTQTVRRVTLSPADRVEIVAEFEPGETAVLRSFEPELGTDFFNERFIGGDDNLDLLEIRAAETLDRSPKVPARLARAEPLAEGDASRVREFELSGSSSINGESFDMGRIDEVIDREAVEVWDVENGSGIPHSFHPHGVRFRVLEIAGEPRPPQLSGWEDTVLIRPDETARILIGFERYADPVSPYMFHCHILEHEDRGMMGQMVVVEPGQEPQPPDH